MRQTRISPPGGLITQVSPQCLPPYEQPLSDLLSNGDAGTSIRQGADGWAPSPGKCGLETSIWTPHQSPVSGRCRVKAEGMTSGTTLDFPVPGLLAEHVRGERCFVRFGSTFDA